MLSSLSSALSAQQDLFLKMLIAQLQNQDPEEPMSNAEMVSQLAQLTNVDALNALNASFKDVLALQRLLNGTGLIGRQVEYEVDGLSRQGTVESVLNTAGDVKLLVDGLELNLDEIRRIYSTTGG